MSMRSRYAGQSAQGVGRQVAALGRQVPPSAFWRIQVMEPVYRCLANSLSAKWIAERHYGLCRADDVQVEFIMLDPYQRITMKHNNEARPTLQIFTILLLILYIKECLFGYCQRGQRASHM